MRRGVHWLIAVSATIGLAACSPGAEQPAEGPAEEVSTRTLASVIAGTDELSRLSEILTRSGLGAVFDGPASYTVLAPGNDALTAALPPNINGEASLPIIVALIRDHILPGHLTPAIIRQAITERGGPVEMRTLGEGTVSLSLQVETLIATKGGHSVPLSGRALVADNGVVIPLDGIFAPGSATSTVSE